MPDIATPYCPDCEPERNVLDEVLDVVWCQMHQPSYLGADDARVVTRYLGMGSSEADGVTCRLYAEFLRGA